MAKLKKNIDYFPFYCMVGKTTKRFQKKFGVEGYGIWIRLLMEIGNADDQYIVLNSDILLEEFEEDTSIPLDKLFDIMNWFVTNTNDFNVELWNDYRIIRNDKLIESLEHLYKKRKELPLTLEKIKEKYSKVKVESNSERESNSESKVKVESNSESKVKEKVIVEYSKVKGSAEKDAESKRNAAHPQHSAAECDSDLKTKDLKEKLIIPDKLMKIIVQYENQDIKIKMIELLQNYDDVNLLNSITKKGLDDQYQLLLNNQTKPKEEVLI